MKLIFLNRFFYPDHSATAQMLSHLAFALAKRSRTVEVVTSRLLYSEPRLKLPKREIIGGVEVLRITTTGFGRQSRFGRPFDYFTFYVVAAWVLFWRVGRGDILVAKTDPPMLSVLAAVITSIKGAHQINWIQDLFPEIASLTGKKQHARLRQYALSQLQKLRNVSLRSACANVVLGRRMAEKVRLAGVSEDRIWTIPNWADGSFLYSIEPSENLLRLQWGLKDFFVVGYCGNLGHAHDMTTFLEAITILEAEEAAALEPLGFGIGERFPKLTSPNGSHALSECFGVRWLFIGSGAQMAALKREVKQRELRSVQFQPYQPTDQLPETLSAPDVHLISLRPELEGFIVPSKYYGIAASGRPAIFVGDPKGELANIVIESQSGFAVAEGDSRGLVRAILTLASTPLLARNQGLRARHLFEAKFNLPGAIEAWEELIHRVTHHSCEKVDNSSLMDRQAKS